MVVGGVIPISSIISGVGRGIGRVKSPPTCFAVRPPFLKPPTCLMPSRSSLASLTLRFTNALAYSVLPPDLRGVRPAWVMASAPATLPPTLNARREIGRAPVFTSAFSGSAGVNVDASTFSEVAPQRRLAFCFIASRRLLASIFRSSEVTRRPCCTFIVHRSELQCTIYVFGLAASRPPIRISTWKPLSSTC